MTLRPAIFAAAIGASCGVLGGAAAVWFAGREPSAGRDAPSALRADVDRIEAGTLAARSEAADALQAVTTRVEAIERSGASGSSTVPGDLAETARALADDVRRLRDATARDLRAADARIEDLERRVDELTSLVALSPLATPSAADAPPTAEEEAAWVNLAQDTDPMRRFSALAKLGRARSDRSVRASIEALRDPSELVVWQAARNLGRFGERSSARELAQLLQSDAVSVRHAAHEALRLLGAPDAGFDPSALPEERRSAADAIARWAAESQ